jgi:hypothetical protein
MPEFAIKTTIGGPNPVDPVRRATGIAPGDRSNKMATDDTTFGRLSNKTSVAEKVTPIIDETMN